jgi:hypothetical protein
MNWYLGRGEEGSMLKVSLTAGALAVAMLVAMTVGKAQAALKPEIAKTEGVTLVGPGGGGGFGGGGGGQKFGGFGGGGRGLRGGDCGGRGLSMRAVRGGDFGPKVGPSAAAFRCSTGAVTVTKFSDFSGRKGADDCQHRKFADDFKHRRFDKFRRFAIYGVPYLYAYTSYGCDWLYRRAIVTGSPYWWNRYYACRDGYYY